MGKFFAILRFVGWGSACRDCINEPHDCEECLGWPRCPKLKGVPNA